jgi:hypothetical protein
VKDSLRVGVVVGIREVIAYPFLENYATSLNLEVSDVMLVL